ncbi:hypothetical protein [Streptomyces sp. SGAir0957]
MFSIPENQVEHHQEIDVKLAGIEREMCRLAERKVEAERERRRLRRHRRALRGRTPARIVRTGLRLSLISVGTVAFVVGGVMFVMGVPAAKMLIDAGTAAWSLAATFSVK